METPSIRTLLADRLGLDPESLGASFFEWVTRRGLQQSGHASLETFVRAAEAGGDAWEALVDHAVVAETWFFRDETPFDYVADVVRQKAAVVSGRPVRILSCPCSTGEEPYSVAMALGDAGLPSSAFRIDAADVSASALAAAETGAYRARAFRSLRPDRDRCFDVEPSLREWRVKAAYRAMVHFRRANLVSLQGLEDAAPYDVILCRNLLIYLHAEARAAVMAVLRRLLADEGVLIVGHAEPAIAREHGFAGDGPPGAFAFVATSGRAGREETAPRRIRRSAVTRVVAPPRRLRPTPVESPNPDGADEGRAAPPTLDAVRGMADRGDLAQAIRACLELVRTRPDSADGHFLLGVLHGATGSGQAAEAAFRRAVYLRPDHAEALVHLALAREARGDADGAARLRARAVASADAAERAHE